jgi:hypothetical protein
MIPPGFVRFWEGEGLHRPYCFGCIHFATERGSSRGLCREYGAYVSLYSSCRAFERRVDSSTPIIDENETKVSYRLGLSDLVK